MEIFGVFKVRKINYPLKKCDFLRNFYATNYYKIAKISPRIAKVARMPLSVAIIENGQVDDVIQFRLNTR